MDDLIRRQDIEWHKVVVLDGNRKYHDEQIAYKSQIDELPSAQPERKKGEWIFKDHLWECNQCGCRCNRANPLSGNIWNYYYCPNCGSDMRGE